jgi:hypothetical protein
MPVEYAYADQMSEQELEDCICDFLDTFGIWYHHDRPARTGRQDHRGRAVWRNHFRGPKGIPDLLIVGNDRVIWAELKTQKGRPTPDQTEWLERLKRAGQEVYVWRPVDWLNGSVPEILAGLR